jgi:hypothetical protein
MWVRIGVAVALGAVLGAGLGLVRAANTVPPTPPAPPPTCPDRLAEAQVAVEQARQVLARTEATLLATRKQRATRRGMERPWPEAPPPELTPVAVQAHLEEALEGLPGTLERVDCEAYPCVGVVRWEVPEEELDLVDDGDGRANLSGALMARLSTGPYGRMPFFFEGRLLDEDATTSAHAVSWLDREDVRRAKQADPEQAAVEGTVVDEARGRTTRVLEDWLSEEGR